MNLQEFFDLVDENRHPRNYHFFVLLICVLGIIGSYALAVAPDRISVSGHALPTFCIFKLTTGLDCPACGLTRAVMLALHADWRESYLMHIWGIPLALLLVLQIPYRLYRIAGGAPVRMPSPWTKWMARAVFLSLLLPWAVKTAAALLARAS